MPLFLVFHPAFRAPSASSYMHLEDPALLADLDSTIFLARRVIPK